MRENTKEEIGKIYTKMDTDKQEQNANLDSKDRRWKQEFEKISQRVSQMHDKIEGGHKGSKASIEVENNKMKELEEKMHQLDKAMKKLQMAPPSEDLLLKKRTMILLL